MVHRCTGLLKQQGYQLGNPPRPSTLESNWLRSSALPKEQGTAMIHIHTSHILKPCKTQGQSVLYGGADNDLHLQKCQLLGIAGVL